MRLNNAIYGFIAAVMFLPLLPEIFITLMASVILVLDHFLGEQRRHISYLLALGTLIGAAYLTLMGFGGDSRLIFNGMFIDDVLSDLLKTAVYLITFVVFIYSRDYIRLRDIYKGEYYVLGLFGVVGMMVMISASHFLTLYLGLIMDWHSRLKAHSNSKIQCFLPSSKMPNFPALEGRYVGIPKSDFAVCRYIVPLKELYV